RGSARWIARRASRRSRSASATSAPRRHCAGRDWPASGGAGALPREPRSGPRSWRRQLVREPGAALGGSEEGGEGGVDRCRLLGGDRVAGARQDEQAGSRHRALEEQAAGETGMILVADDDEQGRRE